MLALLFFCLYNVVEGVCIMNIMAIGNYQTTDNNKRVNNLAFKALHNGYWKEESLRILERTPAEVRELGEYFHKSTPDELEKVARRSNFLGIKKKRESNWALNVLNNAIEQVVESKKTMQRTLDELINKDSVSTEEMDIALAIKTNLKSIDDKFESRHKKFFQEVEPLSESDIEYFKRHDNDY